MNGHGPGLCQRTRMESIGAVVVELLSIQWRKGAEFEWVSCDSNISGCAWFPVQPITATCNQDTSRDLHQRWAWESRWWWRYESITVVAIGSGRSLKWLINRPRAITWLRRIGTIDRLDVLGVDIGPCGSKTSCRTKIFIGKGVLYQIRQKDQKIEENIW